jgi:hypothetical protein
LFVDANGNVGVGATVPQEELHIAAADSTIRLEDTSISGLYHNIIAASNTGLRFDVDAGNVATSSFFRVDIDGGEKARITSDGRLGLGTSSPSTLLDVQGSSAAVKVSEPGGAEIRTAAGGTAGFFGTYSNHPLQILTNSTNAVRIDTSGRVGIGTTGPSGKLDVETASDTYVNFSTTNNGSAAGICILGNNNNEFFGYANNLRFATVTGKNAAGFNERMRMDSSGRLLIGTSTAGGTELIQVQGVSGSSTAPGGIALRRSSISNTDDIGFIAFTNASGNAHAQIKAFCDGTPGASDYPGALTFSTTADGASSPTERMRIEANGNTRYENTNFVFPLTDNVCGSGANGNRWSAVWAANGTIQTSDERAKTDIANAQLGTEFIKSLRPVSYKWIEGGKRHTGEYDEDNNWIYESVPGQRTHWGFIAQEVKEAVDAAGVDFGGWVLTEKDDPDSQQALRYDQFIAPLTKALQEALAEIDVLKTKVAALEAQ